MRDRIKRFGALRADARVIFFDEGAVLTELGERSRGGVGSGEGSRSVEVQMPQLSEFWLDGLHPTRRGHMWLAHQAWREWVAGS